MARKTRTDVVMPTESAGTFDHEKVYTHPAFGLIEASRVQSSVDEALFGSEFGHGHFIVMRVKGARLSRHLAGDRISSVSEPTYIEFAISEAAFGRFISTLNVGEGTPVTLMRIAGEQIPGIPRRSQAPVFDAEMQERIAALKTKVDETIAHIDAEIGERISAVKRRSVLDRLKGLRQEIVSNVPWLAERFGEYVEETKEQARTEIAAFAEDQLRKAGLHALAQASAMPIMIGDGETAASERTEDADVEVDRDDLPDEHADRCVHGTRPPSACEHCSRHTNRNDA